jgi:hypothetical protein
MHRKLIPAALAAASIALAACGDNASTAPRTDGLTSADLKALIPAITASVASAAHVPTGAWFAAEPLAAPGVAALNTLNLPFDQTGACPRGGTVHAVGRVLASYDPVVKSGSLDVSATTTPAACAYDGDAGAVITLTGNPSTQLHATATASNGVPGTVTVSQTGAFTWTRSTGGDGSCTLDLQSVYNPATLTTVTTGNFCGATVNVTSTAQHS